VEGNKKAIALPVKHDANYTLVGLGLFLHLNSTVASTCMPLLLIVVELSCYQVYRIEASCVGLGPPMQGRHVWASRPKWPIEAATGHISVGGV
jgi:hypothetical protein